MARFTTGSDVATLPIDVEPKAPVRRDNGPKPFPNKFGAKCVDCGAWVAEREGNTSKRDGKWEVRHNQPCPEQGAPAPVADDAPVERSFKVPDGRYTVAWDEHYKTLRVQTQDQFDDFMPGVTILKFLSGSNNDSDYTSFGHVDPRTGEVKVWRKHQANPHLREAVKVLLGDPKAASQAYAIESDSCSRCGRTLTVPASLHAGLGPECAKKVTW